MNTRQSTWRVAVTATLVCALLASCSGGGSGGSSGAQADPSKRPALDLPATPDPAPVPDGTIDEQAAALAAASSTHDTDAWAALLTAAPLSGFPVVDDTGTLLSHDATGDGVTVADWELWFLTDPSTPGRIPATDVGAAFAMAAGMDPTDDTVTRLTVALLVDLRAAAASDDDRTRFWAEFIGARSSANDWANPLDRGVDPATISFDHVSIEWLALAFVGDTTFGVAAELADTAPDTVLAPFADSDSTTPTTEGSLGTVGHLAAAAADSSDKCKFWAPAESRPGKALQDGITKVVKGQRLFPDWVTEYHDGSNSKGTWKTKIPGVRDLLKDAGLPEDASKRVGKQLEWGQLLINYAQFIASMMILKADTTLDKNPLPRTRLADSDGEQGVLKAKITWDAPDTQWINCLTAGLALAGVKVGLPAKGDPVKGAEGGFVPVKGFAVNRYASTNPLDAIVEFGADPRPDRQTIDNGGMAVAVIGLHQKKTLPANTPKVMKSFAVRVEVALQKADFVKDMGDAFDAIGKSNLIVRGMQVALDMMKRSRWTVDGTFPYPVQDWQPCDATGSATNDLLPAGGRSPAMPAQDDVCKAETGITYHWVDERTSPNGTSSIDYTITIDAKFTVSAGYATDDGSTFQVDGGETSNSTYSCAGKHLTYKNEGKFTDDPQQRAFLALVVQPDGTASMDATAWAPLGGYVDDGNPGTDCTRIDGHGILELTLLCPLTDPNAPHVFGKWDDSSRVVNLACSDSNTETNGDETHTTTVTVTGTLTLPS